MIEAVTSKVVGAIAVFALLGSVLGFFSIQNSAMEEGSFREMCESLAESIDAASSVNARLRLNYTFNADEGGRRLEPLFRGRGYEIEIRPGSVSLRQDGLAASSALVATVHVWDPALLGGEDWSSGGAISHLDALHTVLKIPSGRGFALERALVGVGGERSYMTFVHI